MDVFPKYIIETRDNLGDCLIISKCTYHKHLATDVNKVKGGGWFKINHETKVITFHGESHDFGQASFEDVKACIQSGNVYGNSRLSRPILDPYKFAYDTGSEIINL